MADTLGERLKQEFKSWDAKDTVNIPVAELRRVLRDLNTDFTEEELDLLICIADKNRKDFIEYDEFIDFVSSDTLATVAGAKLPDGTDSDSKIDQLLVILSKIRDQRNNPKSWLSDLDGLLNPEMNPAGFRMMQARAAEEGAPKLLVALSQRTPETGVKQKSDGSDLARSLAWQCLSRLAFGNDEVADAVAGEDGLAHALRSTLQHGAPPEQLSALQLVQAVAACSGDCVKAVVPALLDEVVPLVHTALGESVAPEDRVLIASGSFGPLAQTAFDIVVSSSFSFASAVALKVGWPQLARLVVVGEERPEWLPTEPLQILLSGRLATNLLSEALIPGSVEDATAQESMSRFLSDSHFLPYFAECLEASVSRREWPNGTNAYHSPARMAQLAGVLAGLGYQRQLSPCVGSLTKAVEVADTQTTRTALRGLRRLCEDIVCLQEFLKLQEFRRETLCALHRSGEEPDATTLLSFAEEVELALVGAQAAYDESLIYTPNAPPVARLAEIFGRHASLDAELPLEKVAEVATEVPLAPSAAVKTSESGRKSFTFQAFAERTYGTPSILGWWPSLMEDAAAELQAMKDVPRVPSLVKAVDLFEAAAQGKSSVHSEVVFEQVLPAAGLPTEGLAVEDEIRALRECGGTSLEFKHFVTFLTKLCALVSEDESRAQAVDQE